MPEFIKKPEIIVFAGPNGSGKSTVKKRKTEYFFWENNFWSKEKIEKLTGLSFGE